MREAIRFFILFIIMLAGVFPVLAVPGINDINFDMSYDKTDSLDNDNYYKQGQTVVWKISVDNCTAVSSVSCDPVFEGVLPTGKTAMTWIGGTGSTNYYTYEWNTTAKASGRYQLAVWVSDSGSYVSNTVPDDLVTRIWLRNTTPQIQAVGTTPTTVLTTRHMKEGSFSFDFSFNVNALDNAVSPTVTLGSYNIMPAATPWTPADPDSQIWHGSLTVYPAMEGTSLQLKMSAAKDKYGNTMTSYTYPQTFTIDCTRPTIQTVTSNPTAPFKNENVSFSIEFSEPMSTTTMPAVTFDPTGTALAVGTAGWSGNTWVSTPITVNQNGTFALSIGGFHDVAGNEMLRDSTTYTFKCDTVAPTLNTVNTNPNATRYGAGNVTFTLTFSENMKTDGGMSVKLGGSPVTVSTFTGTTWTGTINLAAPLNGGYQLNVYDAQDEARNPTATNPLVWAGKVYKVDTDKPMVASITPTAGTTLIAGEQTIAIRFSDTMETTVTPTVKIDNVDVLPDVPQWTTDQKPNDTWHGKITISSSMNGSNKPVAISFAKDIAGNQMDEDTSFSYNIDADYPTVSTINPISNSSLAMNVAKQFTINFSKAMNVAIPLYVTLGPTPGGDAAASGLWNSNTQWIGNITPTSAGTKTLYISGGTDSNGNQMIINSSNQYQVDSDNPTVVSVTTSPVAPVKDEEVTFTINFSEPMDTNAIVAVTIDGVGYVNPASTAWSNGDTTWTGTKTFSSANGTPPVLKTLYVCNFQDKAGNTLNPDPTYNFTFVVDTEKPVVKSVTPANGSYLKEGVNTFTIVFDKGTMETSVTPTVKLGTASPASSQWTGNVTWTGTFNISSGQNGDNLQLSISAAKDQANNEMLANTGYSYTVDTVIPEIKVSRPRTSSKVNNYIVKYNLSELFKEATIEWIWTGGTADAGSPHICPMSGSELNQGSHELAIANSPGTGSIPHLVSMGIYTVRFKGIDRAGNSAANVDLTNVTYDVFPPEFTLVKPEPDTFVNHTRVSYTLSENIVDGTIEWRRRTGGALDSSAPHSAKLAGDELLIGAHNDITLTNNPTLKDQAKYQIRFSAVDALGNKAAKTVTVDNVVYDVSAPQYLYVYSGHNNQGQTWFKNGDTIDLFVKIKRPSPDYYNDDIYTVVTADFSSIMAGQDNIASIDSVDGTFEIALTLGGAPEGENKIVHIFAKDRAGNYSTYDYTINGIDNTAPVISNVTITDADTVYRNGEIITIQVSCDQSGYVVSADFVNLVTQGLTRFQANDLGAGNYQVQFTFPLTGYINQSLTDKTIPIYVRDKAKNLSTNTTLKATLDNKAPAITGASYSDADVYYRDGDTITFVMNSSESGLTVTADFSDIDNRFDKAGHPATVNASAGTYTVEYTIDPTNGLADINGTAITMVYAYDVAGNWATANVTYNAGADTGITLDNTKPTFVSGVNPDKTAYKDNELVILTMQISEKYCTIDADFSLMDSGWNPGIVAVVGRMPVGGGNPEEDVTANYTITAGNTRNDGVYNIPVTATDLAGNFRTYYSMNLQLDNVGPQMVGGYVTDADRIYKNGDTINIVSLWDADNYTVSANYVDVDSTRQTAGDPDYFACTYAGEFATNQHKYQRLGLAISALNASGDGTHEVVFRSRDTSSNQTGNGSVNVYLDNTAPDITTTNWLKIMKDGAYLADTAYIGVGDITVEVQFDEEISRDTSKLPTILLREVYAPYHTITVLEPYTTNSFKYKRHDNILSIPLTISATDGLRNAASIDLVVSDFYDRAGNGNTGVNYTRQVFYYDNEIPSVDPATFALYDNQSTPNHVYSSPYNTSSTWYLKYKSSDLLHSNISAVSVEVTVYENTSFTELKLNWQEEGGHTASKSFTHIHPTGTPGYYTAGVNISVIKDTIVPSDISESETITFWISGKDKAGNTFDNYNSNSLELASTQLRPIVPLTGAVAEINNRWVVPNQINVNHYYAVRLDMRYYDTGINRIEIDTPDTLPNVTSASFTFDHQPKAGSFDFNNTKITYYLSSPITTAGTAEITFQLSTKSVSDSPTGENYPATVMHLTYPSLAVTATSGNADDGPGRTNNDTIVITQPLTLTSNAEIKPHTVAMDKVNTLEYTIESTYDTTCQGINRIMIQIPSTHALITALTVADITLKSAGGVAIPTGDYNVSLVGGVSSAGWTWGPKFYIDILNAIYYKETKYSIEFEAKSFTANDSLTGGKDFTAQIDYYTANVRTSPMTVPAKYLKAVNVVTQPIANGGVLTLNPASSLKNETKAYTLRVNTIFDSGSAGIDTFKIYEDSLEITAVNTVSVNGTNVSFSKTIGTEYTTVQLFSNINSTGNVDINFSAKAPNVAGVSMLTALLENSSNSATADCTPDIPVRIGVPVEAAYPCTTTLGVWINDEYMGAAWNSVPAQSQVTLQTATKLQIHRENTGVNRITLNCDTNFLNPQISSVEVKGAELDATDYNVVRNGNNLQINFNEVLDVENFGPTEDRVNIFFTGITPSTLNYPLVITLTVDNSASSSPKVVTPVNTIYVKQVITSLKAKIKPHYVQKSGEHIYETKMGTLGVPGNYVATTDTGYNKITFTVANHTLFTFRGISEDGVVATAWWTPSPPYIPGVYTLERIAGSNGIDQITTETVEVEFSAVANASEDYPAGITAVVQADHTKMVKPVNSTEASSNSMKIITTSPASAVTASVSPANAGVADNRIFTFTAAPTIDSTKHYGVNQIIYELNPFTVVNASDLSSPTANVTVNNIPYAIDNATYPPLPGKAHMVYDGVGQKVTLTLGTVVSSVQNIVAGFRVLTSNTEGDYPIGIKAANTSIDGSTSVGTTVNISTRKTPAVPNTLFTEVEKSTTGIGNYTVMAGTQETFLVFAEFETDANSSGINQILIDVPDKYSSLSVSSVKLKTAPAGGFTAKTFTHTVGAGNIITVNLNTTIGASTAGYHTVEVQLTGTTPYESGYGTFALSVDSLGFPNPMTAVCKDINENGRSTCEIQVVSNLLSVTGEVQPKNVMTNTGVRFSVSATPVFGKYDQGINMIKIKVPDGYTISSNTSETIKYVFFGGSTEVGVTSSISGQIITIRKTEGTVNYYSSEKRVNVVIEALSPATVDAGTGGKKFEVYVDRDNSSNFPVSEVNDSLHVYASRTTIDSVVSEVRGSKNNQWNMFFTIDFSVGMDTTVEPKVTFKPKGVDELSYSVKQVSYYGDIWMGSSALPYRDDVASKFSGSIEVTVQNIKDVYGNSIDSLTREINIVPGFIITAFQNPLVNNQVAIVVRSSESLKSGSPEVSVNYNGDISSIYMEEIRSGYFRGFTSVQTSKYYSTDVLITAAGTDMIGGRGSETYTFTVAKLSAPRGGILASPDRQFEFTVPANAVAEDCTVFMIENDLSETQSEMAKVIQAAPVQSPEITGNELIALSKVYNPSPVEMRLRKNASVKVAYNAENSEGIKRSQMALFGWNGKKWVYVNSKPLTGFVESQAALFMPYSVMADIAAPVIGEVLDDSPLTFDTPVLAPVSDGGSGINPAKTKVFVDDKPVDFEYIETDSLLQFVPGKGLEPGEHNLRIETEDMVGNQAKSYAAQFVVAGALGVYNTVAYPNPADSEAYFSYTLGSAGVEQVIVKIYDSYGDTVATLYGTTDAGRNQDGAVWDLRNDEGYEVSSGVYFYIIEAAQGGDSEKDTGKVVVLR